MNLLDQFRLFLRIFLQQFNRISCVFKGISDLFMFNIKIIQINSQCKFCLFYVTTFYISYNNIAARYVSLQIPFVNTHYLPVLHSPYTPPYSILTICSDLVVRRFVVVRYTLRPQIGSTPLYRRMHWLTSTNLNQFRLATDQLVGSTLHP